MKKSFPVLLIIFLTAVTGFLYYLLIPKANAQQYNFLSPLPPNADNVPGETIHTTPKSRPTRMNILLMGFDGRKGDSKPRCDALHLVSVDRIDRSIIITSIPRSTKVILPDRSENVLANACPIAGHDFVRETITELTGEKIDRVVRAGFSQTLGVIRNLGLPSVPTLMYLRDRGTGLGDYQRSRNQGNFLKEMLVKYLPEAGRIPKPLQYLMFKTIDTDLTYDEAHQLLSEIDSEYLNNIYQFTVTADYKNYKKTNYTASAASDWEKDEEYLALQNNLALYLKNIISRANSLLKRGDTQGAYNLIRTPYSQKLWLQINEEKSRNSLHFEILEIFAKSNTDKQASSGDILDFITEMELVNSPELKSRGEKMLSSISDI